MTYMLRIKVSPKKQIFAGCSAMPKVHVPSLLAIASSENGTAIAILLPVLGSWKPRFRLPADEARLQETRPVEVSRE